jgi:single-strand DNA-binding protein
MNNVILIGRLTKDPVMYKSEEGAAVCSFTLAIGNYLSKKDHTDYLRVKVFGAQANHCERYLKKGLMTAVNGRLRAEQYTDTEGIVRYPVDVIADRVEFLQWPELKNENGKSGALNRGKEDVLEA